MQISARPTPSVCNDQKGFTLLELVVAFSIIGILTILGFSSFTAYSRRQVLDQAATKIKGGIDQARFNALSRVKPDSCGTNSLSGYTFSLCTGSSCTSSYTVTASCTSTPPVVGQDSIPVSVSIVTSPASETTCTTLPFSILKGYEGAPCQITLSSSSGTRRIIVNAQGATSIQ